MAGEDPWYVAAFRGDYRDVYPHRDLGSARREVDAVMAAGVTGRVLDLCCGFGRHALALAERGVDVCGVDLSDELLAQARGLPGGELLAGRLARADARALPFRDAAFDGLVSLFSSFGYFGDEGDARVLDEVGRVLRAGGRAFLDLMNPARVRAGLVAESRCERGGARIEERRALADSGRRVVKDVRIVLRDGSVRRWRENVRMYETPELASLLRPRGLEVLGVAGDFAGGAYGPQAERQILVARRV